MKTWIKQFFTDEKLQDTRDVFIKEPAKKINRASFGDKFIWGTTISAYQTEGAYASDGKGLSIWDTFTNSPMFSKYPENGNVSTDFYHRYPQDIELLNELNLKNLRMSLSWPRIFPTGKGKINQKGVDYYNKVIDTCLENKIQPWLTLYHWDLPQSIEDKGGWARP